MLRGGCYFCLFRLLLLLFYLNYFIKMDNIQKYEKKLEKKVRNRKRKIEKASAEVRRIKQLENVNKQLLERQLEMGYKKIGSVIPNPKQMRKIRTKDGRILYKNYRGLPRLRQFQGRLDRNDAKYTKSVWTTIKHRELISTIGGIGEYQSYTNSVNPGMFDTFPWLANVGQAFDEYKVISMRISYVPDAGSTVSGTMFMAFNYDPDDTSSIYFNSEETLASYPGACQTKVTERGYLNLDLRLLQWNRLGWYYLRSGPVVGSLRDYDVATLYTATDADIKNVLGRVYIDYVIKFKASNPVTIPIASDLDSSLFSSAQVNTNRTTLANVLTEYSANTPLTITTAGETNRLTFYNNYRGMLFIYVIGTDFTPFSGTASINSDAVYVPWYGGTGILTFNTATGNETNQQLVAYISMYNADYIELNINEPSTYGTVTYVQIVTTPINNNFAVPTLPPSSGKSLRSGKNVQSKPDDEKKEESSQSGIKLFNKLLPIKEGDDDNISVCSEPTVVKKRKGGPCTEEIEIFYNIERLRCIAFGCGTTHAEMHSMQGNGLLIVWLLLLVMTKGQISPPTSRPTRMTREPTNSPTTVAPTNNPTTKMPTLSPIGPITPEPTPMPTYGTGATMGIYIWSCFLNSTGDFVNCNSGTDWFVFGALNAPLIPSCIMEDCPNTFGSTENQFISISGVISYNTCGDSNCDYTQPLLKMTGVGETLPYKYNIQDKGQTCQTIFQSYALLSAGQSLNIGLDISCENALDAVLMHLVIIGVARNPDIETAFDSNTFTPLTEILECSTYSGCSISSKYHYHNNTQEEILEV